MKAPRLVSLAAIVAAFLYLGCLPVAAETAAAPQDKASSIKPIMAPPAAKKTSSARASRQKTAPKDVHVYLFRGLLNVFSLGMDELADKIRATGIAATVYNHTEWEEIAAQIAAKYKNGNHSPIILIGHSLGADAVMFMAASLGRQGIPVALVVPFDGTQTLVASSNVARVLNLTQRDYAYARRGSGFHGELKNLDVSGEGVDHLNIDKSPRLHALVLSNIAAIVKKGETPSSFATFSPDEKEQAKPMPKPAPAEIAAKPEPSQEKPAEAPAADVAAKPAPETPKVEAAPTMAPSPAPASPAVSAAAGSSSAVPPTPVVPPAVAPQPASVPAPVTPISAPAESAPQPASVTPPAKPVAIPAPDRLEYEKLVLPKR